MPFEHEFDHFKVLLQNLKARDGTLYWFDRPIITRHSPEATVGENYTVGGKIVRVVDGGTGLNGIPKDHILYSTSDNVLSTLKIGSVMKTLMSSDNLDDFGAGTVKDHMIKDLKQITFKVYEDDPTYMPNITSSFSLDIETIKALNLKSATDTINLTGKNITGTAVQNISLSAEKLIFDAKILEYSVRPEGTNKKLGIYIKDNLNFTLPTNPTSTITLAGTLGIIPNEYKYTTTSKTLNLNNLPGTTKHSSVIILTGVDGAPDYTINDLLFKLERPENIKGKILIIKSLVNQKVTIKVDDSTFSGFDDNKNEIILEKKYASIVLYANNGNWSNLVKLSDDIELATTTKSGAVFVFNPDIPKPAEIPYGVITDVNLKPSVTKLLKKPKGQPTDTQAIKVTYNDIGLVVGHDPLLATDLPEHNHPISKYNINMTPTSRVYVVPANVHSKLISIYISGILITDWSKQPENKIQFGFDVDSQCTAEILYYS